MLKTGAFALAFVAALAATLYAPAWGVCAYVLSYSIGPERHWWATPLLAQGVRFSLLLTAAIALGTLVNLGKLKFGRTAWTGLEKLLLLFLACVWLSTLLGEPTVGAYTIVDHPTVKMTKVLVFVLLLTHVVTNLKDLNLLLWTLIVSAFWLAVEGYQVPYRVFEKGRLETVGGPDFSESNFLAAYVAAMLPLAGLQFLRTRWFGKLFCLAGGAFATNLLILTRSRGAVLGLALGGLVAIVLAPRQVRLKIAAALLVASLGFLYLADPQFLMRAATITTEEEHRDVSAQSRIRLARAALQMVSDHPLGVGAGNYFQMIGFYIPEYRGRDAHNTYLRCATELGVQGLLVFLAIIGNAFVTLRRVWKQAADLPEEHRQNVILVCYAMTVSLAALFGCCLTISLTYVEFLWWLLALPVCVERAVQNELQDAVSAAELTGDHELCEDWPQM